MITRNKRSVGIAGAITVGVVALGIILFAPGIGCSGTTSSNVSKDARNRAASRHRMESLTQFLDAKAKQVRKQRAAAKAKAAAAAGTPKVDPRSQSAFRAGVSIAIWNRYVANPTSAAKSGTLSAARLARARNSAHSLDRRLILLRQSASQAKLPDLARAAAAAREDLAHVSADLAGRTFTPSVIAQETRLMRNIQAVAEKNGLKLTIKVPAGTLKG